MPRVRYVLDYPEGKIEAGKGRLVCLGAVERPISEGLQIIPDIEPYASPIDDSYVGSRRSRREDLKKNNCRPYERGEKEAHKKDFLKRQDAALAQILGNENA